MHWNAQLLRLTIFLSEPVDGSGLWQSVTGELPEIDENRPREGVRLQAGSFEQVIFQMSLTADRLDWMLLPFQNTAALDHAAFIDRAEAADAQFGKLLVGWFGRHAAATAAKRVACGLVAISPTPDRETAYARLSELVPSVHYDVVNTREVVYQVNRPLASAALAGMQLNRITKWSALQVNHLRPIPGQPIAAIGEIEYFVRCECDHSTPADREAPLPADRIEAICKELRDLALRNIERGEIG